MRYLRFTFSPIEKEKVSSSLDLSGHQLAEPMSVAGQRSSAQSKASSSPCSLRCPSVRQGCQHASCQDFPTEQTEASPFGAEERWCLTFLPRESLPTQLGFPFWGILGNSLCPRTSSTCGQEAEMNMAAPATDGHSF